MTRYKLHKCKNKDCKILTNNKQYCSLRCFGKIISVIKIKKICKYCGKIFYVLPSAPIERKNCSKICKYKYLKKYKIGFYNSDIQKKLGKKGGIIASKINKKNKTSAYFDINIQRLGGNTNKINKTGICGMSHQQCVKAGKIGGIIAGKLAAKTNRKNGTSAFFDKEIQSRCGKKGALVTIDVLRNKNRCIFKNIHYASYFEMEIGMNIYHQIETLIVKKNFQIDIGNKKYDFLIQKYKCFIEPHMKYNYWNPKETLELYTKQRRDNLNKNGYKDYNLMVITQ